VRPGPIKLVWARKARGSPTSSAAPEAKPEQIRDHITIFENEDAFDSSPMIATRSPWRHWGRRAQRQSVLQSKLLAYGSIPLRPARFADRTYLLSRPLSW